MLLSDKNKRDDSEIAGKYFATSWYVLKRTELAYMYI